jgi:hypothetical protein
MDGGLVIWHRSIRIRISAAHALQSSSDLLMSFGVWW